MAVVDFHTNKDLWTIEHVIAVAKDLISECADDEEMKSVDAGITVYELKLLIDAILSKGER